MPDPIQSYKKDGKTYYKFQVYTGVNPKTGKKTQTRRSGFLTKTAAKKARLEIQQSVADGTYWEDKETKRHTVGEVYKEYMSLKENEVKQVTLIKYLRTQKYVISKIGDIYIDKVTNTDIIEAIKSGSNGVFARNEHLFKVKEMFEYARNVGYITRNIASTIPKFKDETIKDDKKTKFLNEKEIKDLLDVAKKKGHTYYLAFYLMIMTGVRSGELRALTWDDFDGEYLTVNKTLSDDVKFKQIVTTPKTKNSIRKIKLDQKTIEVLNEAKELMVSEYIISISGKHISSSVLNKQLSKIHKEFPDEIPKISCHTLRHTHASLLFQLGVNPKVIQKRLGHTDFSTTMNVYTHLFEDFENDNLDLFFNKVQG